MIIDSNYSVHINLSFISKLFFISIVCLAPFLDLQIANGGLANESSFRLKTLPIFFCSMCMITVLFFSYKTNKIIFYKTDIYWFLLSIILIISNFFSIATFEDKISFFLVIVCSIFFAIYFSQNTKDGAQTFAMLISIFSILAISMFLIRLISSGSTNYARGGLNVYTISGVISWLILYLCFLYSFLKDSKSSRRTFYFLNIIITLIAVISANRMGLIASMLIWLVLFLKYNKGFLITITAALIYLVPIIYISISEIYIFQRFGIGNFSTNVAYDIYMNSRGNIWNDSFKAWLEGNILFGTGLGSFSYLSIDGSNFDSAHNFFLNLLGEHGLVLAPIITILFFQNFNILLKKSFFIFSVFIIYLTISGWTIIQPVGMISAFNLIIMILLSRSLPQTKNVNIV